MSVFQGCLDKGARSNVSYVLCTNLCNIDVSTVTFHSVSLLRGLAPPPLYNNGRLPLCTYESHIHILDAAIDSLRMQLLSWEVCLPFLISSASYNTGCISCGFSLPI